MNKTSTFPSSLALKFLQLFCPEHLREEIEGDLTQKYLRDVKIFGHQKAKLKLAWNTIRFFRPGIILRRGSSGESTWLNFRHQQTKR